MQTYRSSCHCGNIVIEVKADIQKISKCNCSICCKKGILYYSIEDINFTLIKGESSLSLYQFCANEASHWFCKFCGIHPFGRPRMDPSRYTVNVHCLENFDQIIEIARQTWFNGRLHPHNREMVFYVKESQFNRTRICAICELVMGKSRSSVERCRVADVSCYGQV